MPKKQNLPRRNELVLCTPTKILPHAVFVKLKEYGDAEGMVHISQVSSRWVKNISSYFTIGKEVICKVLAIKDEGLDLSLKEVTPIEKTQKWNEWKAEKRAENLLISAAKKMKKTEEDMRKEIGEKILQKHEKYSFFIDSLKHEGDEVLKELKLPKKWEDVIRDFTKEKEKIIQITLKAEISTLKPNGIELIKNLFAKIKKDNVRIKYISAPEYLIEVKSSDYKRAENEISKMQLEMQDEANKNGLKITIKRE